MIGLKRLIICFKSQELSFKQSFQINVIAKHFMPKTNRFSLINLNKSPFFYGYIVLVVESIGVLAYSNGELHDNYHVKPHELGVALH